MSVFRVVAPDAVDISICASLAHFKLSVWVRGMIAKAADHEARKQGHSLVQSLGISMLCHKLSAACSPVAHYPPSLPELMK